MSRPAEHLLSERDYLERELAAVDVRHEFVGGRMYAMTGSRVAHARMVTRITASLAPVAATRGCDLFSENFKLRVPLGNDVSYYYPDLIVQCAPVEDEYWCASPVLLIEVSSPSTERTDCGEKLLAYQAISTLREYLVIDADALSVELWRRTHAGWTEEQAAGESAVVSLESLDTSLALAPLNG